MSRQSKAYVTCTVDGHTYKYRFAGVVSIEHSLTLNLEKDSSQGTDIVNGARNKPNQIVLSVVETDAENGSGWSARMLECMNAIKRSRYLCKVVTSMGTYRNMLITGISAKQDEENQYGWNGSITFVECLTPDSSNNSSRTKVVNNSSTRKNTGSAGSKKVTGSPFQQMLQRAGIK